MSDAAAGKPPLDDIMLAMDVVDTLRHQELLVERELQADDRRSTLRRASKSPMMCWSRAWPH
jgi:hypothetical protein